MGHVQVGCVYVVYSKDSGIPSDNMDLDKNADILLRGFEVIRCRITGFGYITIKHYINYGYILIPISAKSEV